MTRWTIALASLAFPAVVAATYFGSAGRVDLPTAWAVIAALAVFGLTMAACADKGMLAERAAPKGANLDKVGQAVSTLMLFVHWILSGLDAGRWGWTPVTPSLRWAGAAAYAIALVILLWATRVNTFYSSAVRVQADRGQVAVAAGPYRVVRHPGYVATIIGALTGGMALGSWLGMAPLAVMAILFLRRTHMEDRMLRAELPGYADYAATVRYRLLPGIY